MKKLTFVAALLTLCLVPAAFAENMPNNMPSDFPGSNTMPPYMSMQNGCSCGSQMCGSASVNSAPDMGGKEGKEENETDANSGATPDVSDGKNGAMYGGMFIPGWFFIPYGNLTDNMQGGMPGSMPDAPMEHAEPHDKNGYQTPEDQPGPKMNEDTENPDEAYEMPQENFETYFEKDGGQPGEDIGNTDDEVIEGKQTADGNAPDTVAETKDNESYEQFEEAASAEKEESSNIEEHGDATAEAETVTDDFDTDDYYETEEESFYYDIDDLDSVYEYCEANMLTRLEDILAGMVERGEIEQETADSIEASFLDGTDDDGYMDFIETFSDADAE